MAAHLRAQERDPIQLGERPAPLRIPVLDTMCAVEAALVECADVTGAEVQRSPMGLLPKTYPAADRTRRELLAMKDAADLRRWRYDGHRADRRSPISGSSPASKAREARSLRSRTSSGPASAPWPQGQPSE